MIAGQKLRSVREQLGLTIREVETASGKIAAIRRNDEFTVNLSRLSDFETKGVVPSIFRIYSLAVIYNLDFQEVLRWYGVDFNDRPEMLSLVPRRKTHLTDKLENIQSVRIPIKLDPTFDLKRTSNIGRLVAQWGTVPLVFLQQFADAPFTYGYIGSEDFTMYPLLMPGSFVRVDESKDKVVKGMWRSEYERPIYFVESREGFTCCWCSLQGNQITLQSHPLSPVPVRTLKHPQDAEVVGQVVGMAMNLDWSADASQVPRERLGLT